MSKSCVPSDTTTLPFTVKPVKVPTVVTLVVPAQVLNAVFSTLLRDKSVFTSVKDLPSTPFAVNFA